ncbi:Predicted PurR-regulated permease PerM [Halobiforma haloterrestris]|uniref:Predicted PurR-regulated permease PerM n=1 Tax=Natronobacterium haloterrestre TaxID=148448 RepID=A0A1I1JNM0_NATHA|nr:AI-2E family transporter [Halobiforma haloterrestris]SFC49562.1 Predicted PurR-regulated permease PerM [Halobiforma haloterrestris]
MGESSAGPTRASERPALAAVAAVAVLLAALVVLPYVQYVLLGIVLAYVLAPAQRQLERYLRPLYAAVVLVGVAILTILLPVAYVLAIAFREALEVVSAVQNGSLDVEAIEARLEATGYTVDLVEMWGTYQEPIATGLQGLATSGLEIVGGLPSILIGITVTLFVLFALLRDGGRLIAWLRGVLPIEDRLQRELLAELDQLMWASVVGNVAVAAIQAVALGAGLAVLEVPAVVFLTVATFVLALLPLVGAFGVWLPISVYLVATDQLLAAAGLVVYGSIVSASDTYLRPALIGRTSAFNSAIVVVGIFGGIVVFGAVGLFVGPVVLGGAKIAVDVYARERRRDSEPGAGRPPMPPVGVRDSGTAESTTSGADAESEAATETDQETETPTNPNADARGSRD